MVENQWQLKPSFSNIRKVILFQPICIDYYLIETRFSDHRKYNLKTENEDRKNKSKGLKNIFNNFLVNSTLHGLKYIGSRSRKPERCIFGISFCSAILLSAYYIIQIYGRWTSTPIIIAINAVSTSITEIPFPAITICNMNQAKRSRVENIKVGSLDHNLLQSICRIDSDVDSDIKYTGKGGTWQYFRQFILNISQSCDELLISCSYGADQVNCNNLFEPILTDEGLCCTFNTVNPKFMYVKYSDDDSLDIETNPTEYNAVDWSPEAGYIGNLTMPYSPVPGLGTGNHMGLSVILNASTDEYYCSSTSSVGFKVLLHSPVETPKIADYGLSILTGMETRVAVTPEKQDSSQAIRSVGIKERKCRFSDEVNKSYFRTYTSSNCQLECESRQMEEQCGCVLYHMPRTSADSVICGPKDTLCVQRVVDEIRTMVNKSSCTECLPACFSLQYESSVTCAQLLRKDVKMRGIFPKKTKESNIDLDALAIVHFFYMRSNFRASIREEFLGFVDFVANSGGILGLFLGFSILSVVELLYFFFVAPCNDLTSRGNSVDDMNLQLQRSHGPVYILGRKRFNHARQISHPTNPNMSNIIAVKSRNSSNGEAAYQWPYCE